MRVHPKRDARRALTLIEVLAAIAIVSVLVVFGYVAWQPLLAHAEGVKCLTHMRSLHASLGAYVQDTGHWPQEPETDSADIDADWWINEMTPYGGIAEVWMCPSIKRAQLVMPEKERWRIHYSPTMFGPEPSDPYKFPTQPWLVELTGMHGRGPNICFPDGSIRQLDDLLNKK
jgi:prepilin-type N-terminal cleavage/methylation domain-containing protein